MARDTFFSPSFGNRPARFVGRSGLIADFEEGLKGHPGNMDRSVVLLGQRGSGKTVFLWELADHARELGYVVATPTIASEGMLERIVEKIQDDGSRFVKNEDQRFSGGSVGVMGFSVGLQFTRETQESRTTEYRLTSLARKLTSLGHGMLILVDELQANSADVKRLVITYQEMVGEGLDVAMVLAGLPGAVSSTLNDKVLTFLNRAKKAHLDPLPIGEVDAFYASAFDELGVSLEDSLRRSASTSTKGSPYLLQLVGHYLLEYSKDDGSGARFVDDRGLDAALLASQEQFQSNICGTILASLSENDVLFLEAMSSDDVESSTSKIAECMGVQPDYAQVYRKRLISAGIIETSRRGYVRYAVPYLSDYVRRRMMLDGR